MVLRTLSPDATQIAVENRLDSVQPYIAGI